MRSIPEVVLLTVLAGLLAPPAAAEAPSSSLDELPLGLDCSSDCETSGPTWCRSLAELPVRAVIEFAEDGLESTARCSFRSGPRCLRESVVYWANAKVVRESPGTALESDHLEIQFYIRRDVGETSYSIGPMLKANTRYAIAGAYLPNGRVYTNVACELPAPSQD